MPTEYVNNFGFHPVVTSSFDSKSYLMLLTDALEGENKMSCSCFGLVTLSSSNKIERISADRSMKLLVKTCSKNAFILMW